MAKKDNMPQPEDSFDEQNENLPMRSIAEILQSQQEKQKETEQSADWDDEDFDDDLEEFTYEDWLAEQEHLEAMIEVANKQAGKNKNNPDKNNKAGTSSEQQSGIDAKNFNWNANDLPFDGEDSWIVFENGKPVNPNHYREDKRDKGKKIEPITIIQETENWVAINKPPYVPSLPERGKFTAVSVFEWAKQRWPQASLCHRIDRETSGVLMIAKNPETHRHFSIQFEKRKAQKLYHAIANNQLHFDNLWVDLPILADQVGKIKIDRQKGKPAQTRFNTLEVFKHFSLLECEPKTGRLHQIRVHLQAQNATIAADILYKSEIPYLSKIKRKMHGDDTALIQRFALHARNLQLVDLDNNPINIIAPYPKDFEVFLKLLRKYDH